MGVNPYIRSAQPTKPTKPFKVTFRSEETGEAKEVAVNPADIPFGDGEWVIVEMHGPVSGERPLDEEDGEFLMLPERIVSVRPLDDEFFDMVGAAYDALADPECGRRHDR